MTTPQSLTLFNVTGNWLSVSAPLLTGVNSDSQIEPVNGLVLFYPRLPKGQTFHIESYLVTQAYNTLQQIWLIGSPNAGTWKLRVNGFTTASIPYNASAATVKAAIGALPFIGVNNVNVTTGSVGQSYNVEFVNDLAQTSVAAFESQSFLSNAAGANCPIEVTVVRQGTPQVVADTAVSLPPIMARIWRGRLSTINVADSVGVQLAANSPSLNNPDLLIYDVSFSRVTFNGADQVLAPFAFVAPSTATEISLTDPELQRLPYAPPISSTYTPGAGLTNWRLRAV